MGFSQEMATLALILNEAKVEESVAWLFQDVHENYYSGVGVGVGGNFKIDISEDRACSDC